jgi:hypothetical protein
MSEIKSETPVGVRLAAAVEAALARPLMHFGAVS